MTGMRADQLAALILAVSTLVGDWQPRKGRRKAVSPHRAVVLALFLRRHDNVQDVAGELFGCSQATVSRVFRKVRPPLEQAADDTLAELEVLVGYDDDPAGEVTRITNRIRGLLTRIHPPLGRVPGPKVQRRNASADPHRATPKRTRTRHREDRPVSDQILRFPATTHASTNGP
ncbi:hypothetical protein Asi03nite_26170 [Actinoplanes siamensis]|uniref:DDE superfamily endonuclease n=1 Tax=Actinoplanes siamensis TaxID=1223317 RepID=A0A919TKA6_9ACTN|nr:hypothetical protein Asi03nite_26170 [Actinoplanes siamensis]